MLNSTTSPGFRYWGGFMPRPTPDGVPVAITSPGSRVMNLLTSLTNLSTPKIKSLVFASCTFLPFNDDEIERLFGSPACAHGTRYGPNGAKVSALFPLSHWMPGRSSCHSLSL